MFVEMVHRRILLLAVCLGFLGGFGFVSISSATTDHARVAVAAE